MFKFLKDFGYCVITEKLILFKNITIHMIPLYIQNMKYILKNF